MSQNSSKKGLVVSLVIIAILLLTNILSLNKSKKIERSLQDTIQAKADLQKQYDELMNEYEEFKRTSTITIQEKEVEIVKLQKQIKPILQKPYVDKKQIDALKAKIAELEGIIGEYEAEIARLKEENKNLSDTLNVMKDVNIALKNQNDSLNKKVELGSQMLIDNITFSAIRKGALWWSNSPSTKAKKVYKVELKFDIVKNLLIESGEKDIYVAFVQEDGETIVDTAVAKDIVKDSTSGEITAPEECGCILVSKQDNSKIVYTKKLTMNVETGETTKDVTFAWDIQKKLKPGKFIINIYDENAYLLGTEEITFE